MVEILCPTSAIVLKPVACEVVNSECSITDMFETCFLSQNDLVASAQARTSRAHEKARSRRKEKATRDDQNLV